MRGFYELVGFLKVIGVIDGILILIRILFKNEYFYVCYKGFYVINVMVICNVRLLFINVVVKWYGLIYDLVVFNVSMLNIYLEFGSGGEGWFFGDRGYVLILMMMIFFYFDKMIFNVERKY